MTNTSDFKPEQKLEATPAAVPTERAPAAAEATALLNKVDSLAVLHQGDAQNAGDPIQKLALVDQGNEIPETEHLLHHAGHGRHGHRHPQVDSGDTVASSTDVTQKQPLAAEAMLDPAMMAVLSKENPGLAAQLAAQNPALANQLAKDNPGLALQLASQNPALAAQLAAQNPALKAQLEAQGLIQSTKTQV